MADNYFPLQKFLSKTNGLWKQTKDVACLDTIKMDNNTINYKKAA